MLPNDTPINVDVNQRFFFFKTLLDKNSPPELQSIGKQAQNIINNEVKKISKTKDEPKNELIDHSLDFLRNMIISARADETYWLQAHLEDKKLKQFEELHKTAEEALQTTRNTNIDNDQSLTDFLPFITYLNIALNGIDNYKLNLDIESKRLMELKKLHDEFESLSRQEKQRIRSIARDRIIRKRESSKSLTNTKYRYDAGDEDAEMFAEFLRRQLGQVTTEAEKVKYQKGFDTQTITNTIAKYLKDGFTALWSQRQKEIKNQILAATNKNSNKEIDIKYIHSVIINLLIFFIQEHRQEFYNFIIQSQLAAISGKEARENILNQFIAGLDQYFFSKTTMSNSDEKTPKLTVKPSLNNDELSTIINRSIQDIKQVDRMESSFFKQAKIRYSPQDEEHKKKRDTFIGFTEEVLQALLKHFPDLQKQLSNNDNNKNQKKEQTLRAKIINRLRKQIKDQYADEISNKKAALKNAKTQEEAQALINELRILKKRSKEEQNRAVAKQANILLDEDPDMIKITLSGDEVAELIGNDLRTRAAELIGPSVVSALTKTHAKADIFLIENVGEVTLKPPNDAFFQAAANALVQTTIGPAEHGSVAKQKIIQKTYIDQMIDISLKEIKANKKQRGFTATEYDVKSNTQILLKQWEQQINALENFCKQQEEKSDAWASALHALKNEFRISDSVKEYDKYNNETGFHGGSIGGSLEHQLDNLLELFATANPDKGEQFFGDLKNGLLFSIYNSGSQLVGAENKLAIEQFLRIFAVSLLFDDCNFQMQMIQQQLKNTAAITPRFFHVYLVNGIYIPSSYVLLLTYKALMKAYNNTLSSIKSNAGSEIHINNHINPSMIEDHSWNKTFQQHQKEVFLSITFLAGFVDILKQLKGLGIPT